ncbi:MAG: D-aminoacyl-tRNA deacylase [Lachnospiraceae bacterium]|nr:D-aminoacyl-tRNA deacylase [Lachnospiraceae bacterium]
MRLLVQVVSRASVTVDGETIGKIGNGYLIFAGFTDGDDEAVVDRLLDKCMTLRILPDENGKTNKSLADQNGSVLIISQFTLYADMKHGHRPSFTKALEPKRAEELYEYLLKKAAEYGRTVQHGKFGAEMHVDLCNEGPFTVMLDSAEM